MGKCPKWDILRKSSYVVYAGFELVVLLSQPPKHWDYRPSQ